MHSVRRMLAVIGLLTGLLSLSLPALPASAADNYPWRYSTVSAPDPWGFTQRQCVSFTAFRLALAHHRILNTRNQWGNASHWDEEAGRHRMTITRRPKVGSVAQWNAYERGAYYAHGSATANGWFRAGAYGHVGYVTGIYADGSVRIEQYNLFGTRTWSAIRVRAPRYLYIQ